MKIEMSYETNKKELYKVMFNEEITQVEVNVYYAYEDGEIKGYINSWYTVEGEEGYNNISYSESYSDTLENRKALLKKAKQEAKKISSWLNDNYTVAVNEIDV